jgi:methionyl aminopeptidase
MPSPDADDIRDYRRAGKIAKDAIAIARESTKEGVLVIDAANRVEKFITDSGASIAFPINICLNHVAAHYTPSEKDPLKFARGDLVKLDVGVHVNGCIADTATTVEITTSNWVDLIKASQDALDCALEMLVPGVGVSSLGSAIETAIQSRGFSPVKNLTGHSMERNLLHAGTTVPNFASGEKSILKSGTVVAIEPFATDGKGSVSGNKSGNIYHVIGDRALSDDGANRFLASLVKKCDHLPFASRWCSGFSKDYESLIKKHWRHGNIRSYSILSVKAGSMVTQAEHSAMILDGEVIVYTR